MPDERHQYLREKGWYESTKSRRSTDANGNPVPWITYPCRAMLERVVRPSDSVFEFGSGYSSLWWAARAKQVVSVEHDPAWGSEVSALAPDNLSVLVKEEGAPCDDTPDQVLSSYFRIPEPLIELPRPKAVEHGLASKEFAAYATEICRFGEGHFDIVVIDGMARALTSFIAARYLKPTGFLVFDNAERRQYNHAFRLLAEAGFRRIDFYGPGPILSLEWCTSIFAKDFAWLSRNVEIPEGRQSDID